MEGLNNKTLSFPAKYFTRAFAALGMVLALAACNDGGGGGGTVVVPPIYGSGCTNCAGSIPTPVVLTTFQMQSANANITFSNMQMIGQSTRIIPNASGNNYRNYEGPIAVQGQMVVAKPEIDPYNPSCVIQPGTYTLQTYSVGQMGYAGGDIVVPTLLSATSSIEMRIDSPEPTMAGALLTEQGQRLYAKVTVLRVNGYTCSQSFFGIFN
ncbi:hypothetical protein [Bdellovibrio bacteriovorus]|uniref:hypothetical protein n=1 Tax=Bdellovibrio TaxID=958 RepID=UPI0035A9106C